MRPKRETKIVIKGKRVLVILLAFTRFSHYLSLLIRISIEKHPVRKHLPTLTNATRIENGIHFTQFHESFRQRNRVNHILQALKRQIIQRTKTSFCLILYPAAETHSILEIQQEERTCATPTVRLDKSHRTKYADLFEADVCERFHVGLKLLHALSDGLRSGFEIAAIPINEAGYALPDRGVGLETRPFGKFRHVGGGGRDIAAL